MHRPNPMRPRQRPRATRLATAAFSAATLTAALGAGRGVGAQEYGAPPAPERATRFLAAVTGSASPVPIDPERTPFLRARIAVDVRGQTLAAAVETIARAAGIRVIYSPALLPATRRVELQASGISVASALADVLMGTDLDVLLSAGGQAVLVRRPTLGAQQQLVTILGQVTDSASRRPLAGAQVALDRTTHTAVADDVGQYRLPGVLAGTYSLTVRRVGYAPTRQRVVVTGEQNVTVNVRLAVSANPLERVVVTGTVVATRQKALPNAITVISAQQLQERGITQITQLFRGEVPGVFTQNAGVSAGADQYGAGADATYVRGSSQIGGGSSPFKVYVDGIELANSSYLNTLDPKMIDHIEIINGPEASTIYGSRAINGVMQIFTKRGALNSRPSLSAQLAYGVIQNNFASGLAPAHDDALQLSGGFQAVTYRVGASYTTTGQWTPGDYSKEPVLTGNTQFGAPNGPFQATVSARFSQRQIGRTPVNPLQGNLAQLGEYRYSASTLVTNPSASTLNQQTLGVEFTHRPTSWWTQTATVGTDQLHLSSVQRRPSYTTPVDSLLNFADDLTRRTSFTYSSTVTGRVKNWLGATLTAGADHWQAPEVQLNAKPPQVVGQVAGPSVPPDPDNTIITRLNPSNTGAFAQAQVAVHDLVFLTAGLRGEKNPDYGADYGISYAPRYGASLAHAFGPVSGKLRVAYGKATRPPGTNQTSGVYLGTAPGYPGYYTILPNHVLGPESQRGWERGAEVYVGQALSLSVTRYDQTVHDLIALYTVDSVHSLQKNDAGQYDYQGISQFGNIGDIRNRGWEGSATAIWRQFSARGTWSNVISRLTRVSPFVNVAYTQYGVGDQFGGVPEHTAALGFTYHDAGTTVNVTTSFTGQLRRQDSELLSEIQNGRFGNDAAGLPRVGGSYPSYRYQLVPQSGYAMTDLTATRKLARGVEGYLNVRNLGNSYPVSDFTSANVVQGRVTMVGLRRTW